MLSWTADIARSGYALVGQFPVYEPRTFMHSASFIAMGHAFPAALGAKVAFPDRQVVSVSGDGSFIMTGQELATAVQHGINVVAIVINDRCLTGNRRSAGRALQRPARGRWIWSIPISFSLQSPSAHSACE